MSRESAHLLDQNRNISLVDEEKYKQRKDLIFTGRTLFGAMPPKGQEMMTIILESSNQESKDS